MRLCVYLMLACLLFLPSCAYGQNPFMSSGGVAADAPDKPEEALSEKQSEERFGLMNWAPVRFISGYLAKMQSTVRRDIERFMAGEGDAALPSAVLFLVFFSFLYGMLHAAGPGHGKVFIGSYMIAGQSRFIDTVKAAITIVAAHTLSAGLLIIALMIFLGAVTLQGAAAAEGRLQLVSAVLICLVGAYLLIRSVVFALRKNKNSDVSSEVPSKRGLFALALSVGVIPCPGVTLVMLFAINLGMIPAGIIAVLAMAIGMFVTITLIGMLFLAAGKSALKAGRLLGQRRGFIVNGLSIGGALLIVGFGFLLLAGY